MGRRRHGKSSETKPSEAEPSDASSSTANLLSEDVPKINTSNKKDVVENYLKVDNKDYRNFREQWELHMEKFDPKWTPFQGTSKSAHRDTSKDFVISWLETRYEDKIHPLKNGSEPAQKCLKEIASKFARWFTEWIKDEQQKKNQNLVQPVSPEPNEPGVNASTSLPPPKFQRRLNDSHQANLNNKL